MLVFALFLDRRKLITMRSLCQRCCWWGCGVSRTLGVFLSPQLLLLCDMAGVASRLRGLCSRMGQQTLTDVSMDGGSVRKTEHSSALSSLCNACFITQFPLSCWSLELNTFQAKFVHVENMPFPVRSLATDCNIHDVTNVGNDLQRVAGARCNKRPADCEGYQDCVVFR